LLKKEEEENGGRETAREGKRARAREREREEEEEREKQKEEKKIKASRGRGTTYGNDRGVNMAGYMGRRSKHACQDSGMYSPGYKSHTLDARIIRPLYLASLPGARLDANHDHTPASLFTMNDALAMPNNASDPEIEAAIPYSQHFSVDVKERPVTPGAPGALGKRKSHTVIFLEVIHT
jgi:hypothetical protein